MNVIHFYLTNVFEEKMVSRDCNYNQHFKLSHTFLSFDANQAEH